MTPIHTTLRTLVFGCLCLPAFALAQSASKPPAAASPPDTIVKLDEFAVTGSYGQSLERAVTTKRKAEYSLDAVNSEDIGKFPTRNVSEALQLVPGVTLDRQRGEGLYVSVRGLGPQFQNTELNGRTIAVNELVENGGVRGRNFRFEVLPSEFVSQIEVVKTTTADMDEGALGGNINIRTVKPLDIGRRITGSVRASYNDLTEKTDPSAAGLVSWVNEKETIGILFAGLDSRRHVRNDRSFNFGWNLDRFTSAIGPGLYTPTRTRPTIELENRKLLSGALSFQWHPTANWHTDIDILTTSLEVDYDEFGIDIFPDDRTFRTPAWVPGSQRIVGDTVVAGRISNVRWMASRETSLNRHNLTSGGIKQTWTSGPWTAIGDLNYSKAHSYHPKGRGTTRDRVAFFGPLEYDFSRGYKEIPVLRTDRSYSDPNNFVGQVMDYTPKDSKDKDFSLKADVSRTFDTVLKKVAIGAQRHERNRTYNRRDWTLSGVNDVPLATLGASFVEPFPVSNYLSSFGGDTPRTWLAPSKTAFYKLLYTDAVANEPLSNSDRRNSFVVDEKIDAAYIRGDFAFKLGDQAFTGNAGERYARTKQVSSGTLINGSTPVPVSYPKSYTNWLPSFNIRTDLFKDLVGRFAVSRVVTRPNVVDTAPRISVSRDSPTASGGNPELNPFLATQYDAAIEWYLNRKTTVTATLFYKKMDDYITAQNVTIQVPGRGDILVSTQVNGGSAKLSGYELAFNHGFSYLPAPFNHLGMQASYTRTESKANYFAGSRVIKDDIIGLSKSSYGLLGYFEQGPLSARVGYFWRDKFLTGIGSSVLAPSFTAPFGSVDAAVSVRLGQRYSLSLDVTNLAAAKKFVYAGSVLRPMEINNYGRTFSLAVSAKF